MAPIRVIDNGPYPSPPASPLADALAKGRVYLVRGGKIIGHLDPDDITTTGVPIVAPHFSEHLSESNDTVVIPR